VRQIGSAPLSSLKIHPEVSSGNAVIGSGAIAAPNWLNYRKQNVHRGLAHSLLHLTEAKQFAEVESTVGRLCQIALLCPGAWKGLEGGQEMLQRLVEQIRIAIKRWHGTREI